MKVKVLYFAKLRELFGMESEELELPGERVYAAAIVDLLRKRGEPWSKALSSMPVTAWRSTTPWPVSSLRLRTATKWRSSRR